MQDTDAPFFSSVLINANTVFITYATSSQQH